MDGYRFCSASFFRCSTTSLSGPPQGEVQLLETDHVPGAIFYQDDFVTRLVTHILLGAIGKLHRQRVARLVKHDFHFGHAHLPSLVGHTYPGVFRNVLGDRSSDSDVLYQA
jgi:hypothetical protein